MNRFVKWIWEARNLDENNRKSQKKHYYEFEDMIDQIKHTSPGFQDLWDIADFLNIIEYTYFYNNNRESGFWSDGQYGNGKTKFSIICANDDISTYNIEISCALEEKNNHITLTVKNNTSSKVAELEFKDAKWVSYRTEYDDILLDYIISIIWDKFLTLVKKYYYKNNQFCIKENELLHYSFI